MVKLGNSNLTSFDNMLCNKEEKVYCNMSRVHGCLKLPKFSRLRSTREFMYVYIDFDVARRTDEWYQLGSFSANFKTDFIGKAKLYGSMFSQGGSNHSDRF
jgi:hypothetical protein